MLGPGKDSKARVEGRQVTSQRTAQRWVLVGRTAAGAPRLRAGGFMLAARLCWESTCLLSVTVPFTHKARGLLL